ncbi:hypothetical protein K435DRAFT_240345 [Dendrothele bispora CBS 962.96]|uniref:BTB domain-containing protein n=1 Tax=Dendrothele bispora (strain CBS 962.96) TaxID=1314807 RepID=A0A4S8MLV0_DENBC|nr:hypothetical protein K435DRAFT_240345 [Dendrothele bispora CBS 962.96]
MGFVIEERAEPWFDDGNIILLTREESFPQTAFKVHRGVLARHSEVFQGMLEIPNALSTSETIEGCQIVPMWDIPVELGNLIRALYDGPSFHNRDIQDFFYLAGILRLATKYFIAHLRNKSIQHLSETWSHTLRGHEDMIELAIRTPMVNKLSYPFVHPLHVLKLARETHVRLVLPAAVYFLSLYPLEDLLKADHAKLRVEHPSKPSSHLDAIDLQEYTLMFQRRLDIILEFVRDFCGPDRTPTPECSTRKGCERALRSVSARLSNSWVIRTGPFNFMAQAISQVSQDSSFCIHCRDAFVRDGYAHRQRLWDELPSVIGLPCWEELQKEVS